MFNAHVEARLVKARRSGEQADGWLGLVGRLQVVWWNVDWNVPWLVLVCCCYFRLRSHVEENARNAV